MRSSCLSYLLYLNGVDKTSTFDHAGMKINIIISRVPWIVSHELNWIDVEMRMSYDVVCLQYVHEVFRKINSPSGNIFRVFAVACAVSVSDLEHGSDGASVLAGNSLQTDVVLAAVFRVGVTAERASVGHLTGSGASETVRYFWETPKRLRERECGRRNRNWAATAVMKLK